jgi:hypothetical protein
LPTSNNNNNNNSGSVVVVDDAHAYLFDRVDTGSDPFRRQQNLLVVATRVRLSQVLAPLFAPTPSSSIPRPTVSATSAAGSGQFRRHSRTLSTASSTSSYSSYSGSYRYAGSLSPGSNTTAAATATAVMATCTEYSVENPSGASHVFLLQHFDSAAALVAALGPRPGRTTLVLTVRRGALCYTLVDLAPNVTNAVLHRVRDQVLTGHARVTGFVDLAQRADALHTIAALRYMFPHTGTPVTFSASSKNTSTATATTETTSGSEDEQWHNESANTSVDSALLKSPPPLGKHADHERAISMLRTAFLETQAALHQTQAELQRKIAELEECQASYIELAEMAGTVLLDPPLAATTTTTPPTHTQKPLSPVQDVTVTLEPSPATTSVVTLPTNAAGPTTPLPENADKHPCASTITQTQTTIITTNRPDTSHDSNNNNNNNNMTYNNTNNRNDPNNNNNNNKNRGHAGAGAASDWYCRSCLEQSDTLRRLEQTLAARELEVRGLRAEHVSAQRESQYLIRQYNRAIQESRCLRQQLEDLNSKPAAGSGASVILRSP